MKYLIIIIGILALGLTFVVVLHNTQYVPKKIGILDAGGEFANDKHISIQHTFYSWDRNPDDLVQDIAKANALVRTPLLTIEPWPHANNSLDGEIFLEDIAAKKYDVTINAICSPFTTLDKPVYIRWGHEMELSNLRYPWAGKNPQKYINAYKHFVDLCRPYSKELSFIWSPSGEADLVNYWPGDTYVDIIGLSLYSFKEWEEKEGSKQRSFNELLSSKYQNVVRYNKPIIIAEMGVTGSNEYKTLWLKDAGRTVRNYKKLFALVYFNSYNPTDLWDPALPAPDWRITSSMLTPFYPIEK